MSLPIFSTPIFFTEFVLRWFSFSSHSTLNVLQRKSLAEISFKKVNFSRVAEKKTNKETNTHKKGQKYDINCSGF